VTLLGYQQALCDLVASPQLCLRVRADATALDAYDLTERERDRLCSVVAQPGMSTSCTLYRVNRITPLYSYLPLTCTLLGDELIHEAERYWHEGKPGDLQFGPETQRFSRYLEQRIADGAIANPYVGEVLELELAANALRWGADPPTRTVRFSHDPGPLLEALADGRQPDPGTIAPGDYTVGLDASSGEVKLSMLVAS
jgi:hypothetical protein